MTGMMFRAARERLDGYGGQLARSPGKRKTKKSSGAIHAGYDVVAGQQHYKSLCKYFEVLVAGSHSETNQLQEMLELISDTKILTRWINACIQSGPDGQQEAEQEYKDGGDNKETGADTKTIAEHFDINISKIHHQSFLVLCIVSARRKAREHQFLTPVRIQGINYFVLFLVNLGIT
jgi:hypothetical protein